ncbi:MAG: tetratricopeptide repeat protein [Bacteroidetes bacterium]|nr:tetratricopeptide repeat protein [Bacteroidota bacterium]
MIKNIRYFLFFIGYIGIANFIYSINLDSLIHILDTSKQTEERIDAYNKLGWELRFVDNNKSREYLKESFKLLAKNNYQKGRAQALNNYGCTVMLTGAFQEAEDSLNKSFELYKNLNLNEEAGKTLTNIGSIYFYQGNVNEAISYCEKAMTYFKDFPEKAAMTNVNMGVMYRTIGNYELAIKKQLSALAYFKNEKDTSKQITSLNNIGSLYLYFKQYDKAIDYHNQAIDLSQNYPQGKGAGYGGKGSAYLKLKLFDEANDNYNKALRIFDSLDLKKDIATTTYNIGDVLFNQKKYKESFEKINQAKIDFISLKLEREKLTCINMIGLIYFELNKHDSALVYLQQAFDLQKKIEDPVIYQSTLRNLAGLYELKGDTSKANKLYHVYNDSKDSIFSVIAAEKVAESEAKFRLHEKDQQLFASKNLNKSLSEKLKGYSLWMIILLCLIVFFMIIYFQKRKEAKFIKDQKELILKKYTSLEDAYANIHNSLEQFQQNKDLKTEYKTLPDWINELSKRELEVLSCLAIGMTDQEISEKLFVSLATVRTHCRRIYTKLLVKNRSEAANFAREYGLI